MNKLIAGVMIAALCVVTGVNFIYAQTSFTNSININFPTVSLSTIVWDTSCEDNAWCFDQGVGEASDALGLIQKASDKLNLVRHLMATSLVEYDYHRETMLLVL